MKNDTDATVDRARNSERHLESEIRNPFNGSSSFRYTFERDVG